MPRRRFSPVSKTQKEIAIAVNVASSTPSRYLSGKRIAPLKFVTRLDQFLAESGWPLRPGVRQRLEELCGRAHEASGSTAVQAAHLREELVRVKVRVQDQAAKLEALRSSWGDFTHEVDYDDYEYDAELDTRVNQCHQILNPLGFRRVCALDSIAPGVINQFRAEVDAATGKEVLQKYLWEYPQILVRFLGPRYCWWIKQDVRLGKEVRVDFLAARTESHILNYTQVQIESPADRWRNPSDDGLGERLEAARQQVAKLRYLVTGNGEYVRRSRPDGQGLVNLRPHTLSSHILLGRRKSVMDSDREHLNAMTSLEARCKVNTYDSIIAAAGRRPVNDYGQGGDDTCIECCYIVDDFRLR